MIFDYTIVFSFDLSKVNSSRKDISNCRHSSLGREIFNFSSPSFYRNEELQNERLRAATKSEAEFSSMKMSFDSQLSALRSVIAKLEASLESRNGEVERLQNELIAAQARIDDSTQSTATSSSTAGSTSSTPGSLSATDVTEDRDTSVSKIVK